MPPVIIVGMARSGTTLVSHILGSLPDIHIEVEPHALWKSGNYKYFNDEEYDVTPAITSFIRKKFLEDLNGKTLLEKSPINCLRPRLVHAVFPDAKIVYIERDPVRCIYSNYNRSVKKDSFRFSITLKKYFFYTGSKDLSGAISNRKIFQQISLKDIPNLAVYAAKMVYLRQFSKLPFGPKLKNFMQIVKHKGLLGYHVEVYKRSLDYKQQYMDLYGKNFEVFKMENIMADAAEIKRIVEFVQKPYSDEWVKEIRKSFDKERVNLSAKTQAIDKEIEMLLYKNI